MAIRRQVMWPFKRKPLAVIRQIDNTALWWIDVSDELPVGWATKRKDWETCPGTLHETYHTSHEALLVAQWWGYRIR